VAKKRRRRPTAGPPPARSPKRVAETTGGGAARAAAPKRRRGEPVPPSFRGVLIRAVLVAVLFFPYLIYVAGETAVGALVVSALAFALMIPLGMLLDRWRYRTQMRRLERARAR
jgi:hypothetical protein